MQYNSDQKIGEVHVVQANRGWMMQMSEWVTHSNGNPGLNVGGDAAHIIVYDREKKVLTEEVISPAIVRAMRNMYQSSLGRMMKATGMFKHLKVRLPPVF